MKRIDEAQTDNLISLEQIYEIRKELLDAHGNEEMFWKQKSRNQWLKEGDRNTRFFHATTKNRTTINKLVSIQGRHGDEMYGN